MEKESEVKVKVSQSYRTLWDPSDYTVHGILQARILEWVAVPFFRGYSQPRDWTQVSRIAGGFLPAEPQGKPKNTGVGSLSLLQLIFPTQESNQGLLYCRRILYQLNYRGSPTEGIAGSQRLIWVDYRIYHHNFISLFLDFLIYKMKMTLMISKDVQHLPWWLSSTLSSQ